MLLQGLDNLVDLKLLAVKDVPLVDDEEDVPLERLESGLDDHGLLLDDRGRFGLPDRGRGRSGNNHGGGGGFRLTEAEGQTGESLDLEVSLGTLLRVEVVVDKAGVAFEVEGDSVGKPDVHAKTGPEGGRDALAIPKIIGGGELGLESVGLIVVESVVRAHTTEDVRIDGTVELVAGEQGGEISHEVDSTLDIVVLVDISHDGALALPSVDVQPRGEDRRELVSEGDGPRRGKKVSPSGLTDGLGDTTLKLKEPVRVKILLLRIGDRKRGDERDTCKNSYYTFHDSNE